MLSHIAESSINYKSARMTACRAHRRGATYSERRKNQYSQRESLRLAEISLTRFRLGSVRDTVKKTEYRES